MAICVSPAARAVPDDATFYCAIVGPDPAAAERVFAALVQQPVRAGNGATLVAYGTTLGALASGALASGALASGAHAGRPVIVGVDNSTRPLARLTIVVVPAGARFDPAWCAPGASAHSVIVCYENVMDTPQAPGHQYHESWLGRDGAVDAADLRAKVAMCVAMCIEMSA